MIVYGDPAYETDLGELVARLRARLESVRLLLACRPEGTREALGRLDGLRLLVVQAGQVEQAAADAFTSGSNVPPSPEDLRTIQSATMHAAQAFVASWSGLRDDWSMDAATLALESSQLNRMSGVLATLDRIQSVEVTVKIPEGFAFYGLYPEQYIQAALDWSRDHASVIDSARSVVVVGIRSIGTCLSALVAAVLVQRGWQVHRLTVRPTGHPFERQVHLKADELGRALHAIIVDEGPGLSGSSMAAAAAALTQAGIQPGRISILAGHGHGPGHAASPAVRAWWAQARRYIAPLSDIRWGGRTLTRLIAELTPELLGEAHGRDYAEDFSAGQWRAAVFDAECNWPAVCAPFERTKYRCACTSGRAALWKFAGFACGPDSQAGCEEQFSMLSARAERGWTVAPVDAIHGFVVSPWVEGRPLRRENCDEVLLMQLGRYIRDAQGPLMNAGEQRSARQRLDHMLYWNARESLGADASERIRSWGEAIEWPYKWRVHRYGDGHLAPHEWLRAPTGRIVKTDGAGHVFDHTMIGIQPVVWDVAGAMVEWDMDAEATAIMLRAAHPAGLQSGSAGELAWYQSAYAAFRMGQCTMCAAMGNHESGEDPRLTRAAVFYQRKLENVLRRHCAHHA
jgi:hypothetical protein